MNKASSTSDEDKDEDIPSMKDVAACLEEAGFYDASMSNEEMYDLYRVLNHSKTTATVEDEQRRILEETDRNCSMIDEMRLHSVPVESSQYSEESIVENCEMLATCATASEDEIIVSDSQKKLNHFDEVDVFNSVPTKHPPLSRITYKPKYNPPFYCSQKIAHLSFDEKVRAISEYHKKLIEIYDRHQRQSKYYAPLGKPIPSDIRFSGSLLKNSEKDIIYDSDNSEDMFQQDDNSNEVYITKTGRLTKRKLYTENRHDEKKINSSTIACDSPSSSQPKKRLNMSTLKNDDIIKRSKLFTDHNSSRSDKLFDKLRESQEKHEEEEKENEKFVASLQPSSEDDFIDISNDVATIVHSEEPFIARRIVPPKRGRPPKGRGRGRNNKPKEYSSKKGTYEELEITTVSSTNTSMGTCPICNREYPQDKLETHADQCLDSLNEDVVSSSAVSTIQTMTCENCDEVLPLNMDYEIHVRECLAQANLKTFP